MPKNLKQLNDLDDAPLIQNYENNPIQNYGMNLLKRMGFTQQRGIGFNKQNALNQPLILKPRPKGLGLGAKKQDALEEKQQFNKQDFVLVNCQPHKGMIGIVKKVKKQQEALTLELGISGTQIKVSQNQVTKITKQEYKELKQKLLKEYNDKLEQNQEKKKKKLKWILPHIRCKVTDKLSPYYLKKVIITELINQRQFEALYLSQSGQKKYLKQLTQKQLQTVLPKPGSLIILLNKKFKGQKAKLLQRNKQKGEVVVQLIQTLEIQNIDQDYAAQYVDI